MLFSCDLRFPNIKNVGVTTQLLLPCSALVFTLIIEQILYLLILFQISDEFMYICIFHSASAACLYEQKTSDVVTFGSEMEESKRGFTAAVVLPLDQGLLCVTADQQFFFYTTVELPDKKSELVLSKRLVGYNEEILDMRFLGDEEQHLAVATNLEHVICSILFPFMVILLKGY